MEATGIVDGYSYWTFTDIFEENYFSSVPFHGGFGLLNIYGIPKPAYSLLSLKRCCNRLGNELLQTNGTHDTADVWVVRKAGMVNIIITNWALPRHAIKTELVRIRLENIKVVRAAYIERIDDDHANAPRAWVNMGRPDSLLPHEVSQLETTSLLVKRPIIVDYEDDAVVVVVIMPPQSSAYVTIEINE